MLFKNFSQSKLHIYYAIACIILLSLIIADNVFSQSYTPPSNEQRPIPKATQGESPVNDERINSINDRITLLKKLLRDNEEAANQPPSVDPKPGPEPQAIQPDPDSQQSSQPPMDMTPPSNNLNPSPTETDTKPPLSIPIVTEPLDPFALGNSLFMTRNYDAAMKSFQKARENEELNEGWAECMLGCCHRLQGNYQRAEEMFREVSNNKKADAFAVNHSRWFLSFTENRRKSISNFQAIENQINTALQTTGLGNER